MTNKEDYIYGTNIYWETIRKQLSLEDKDGVVIASCPHCGLYIGSWEDGGYVDPASLYYGDYVCPDCDWKPKRKKIK
jgi:hypothetical protein